MSEVAEFAKRLLVGRPMRSERLGHTLLPKHLALPVFASDALSSVAYASDEIMLTLAVAGMGAMVFSPWVGLAVVVVMVTVVASYRQNVHAYPSGGGDFEVATTNLGPSAGLTVASALMVEYTLTVAVSISSGAMFIASAVPFLQGHETGLALALVAFLALVNLRGVKTSGTFFAIPVYCFIVGIAAMTVVGLIQVISGSLQPARSAAFELVPDAGHAGGLVGVAGAFLVARAFASGCAALSGVEAISNGVPAFREPKSKNAATTLAMLGAIASLMMMSVMVLARRTGVRFVEDPAAQLTLGGGPIPEDYVQFPTIAQISETVFHFFPPAFFFVSAATGIILILASNTAFNGFPVLGSVLGKEGFLPRQLHTRGDRLAYSNGILVLAGAALVLIWSFDAQVTRLIQLYIVGVFVSFTASQVAMVRHWNRLLRTAVAPKVRAQMKRRRVVNSIGMCMTGAVLLVVLVTKFTRGAWIAIGAMALVFATMRAIHRHYETVRSELALDDGDAARMLPSRVHAIVLVSKIHRPTMRALAYARVARPQVLEAVTVDADDQDTAELVRDWEDLDLPVPLRVLDSPYREITRPILAYVRSIRRASPRDLVVVYIPEYVVGHWWEHLLHNQSALRLKTRLLFTPGVVVASVPWQLASSRGQTGLEGEDFARRMRRF